MCQTRKRIDRVLSIVLALFVLLGTVPFQSVYAITPITSTISTNLSDIEFVVNKATEFTVTSTANSDSGKMVKGYFNFSDMDAIEKLEYYETAEGMQGWYTLQGEFGPASGFPITDATSKFRVTFKKTGYYDVDISLKDVVSSEVYCSVNTKVTVKSDASTISTDIENKKFTVGKTTEFTFTSTANGDAGKMVKGSFVFNDPSAIEKLEYYETTAGMQGWYELHGDFGPEAGFPVIDGTSKFRVTFKKAGEFSVVVSLKEVATNSALCSTEADIKVAKADITDVSFSATSNKYDDGKEYELVTINGNLQPGDNVSYTIEGESNLYASIPKKSAVGEYKVTVKVDRGSNYNVYTQTVTSKIELGEIELGNIKVKGLEGVYTGKAQKTVEVTGKGAYSLQYRLGDGEWSDSIPAVTDAGSYTVQVKATKINYNDKDVTVDKAESAVYPFNVYIAKAEQKNFAFEETESNILSYNSTKTYPAKGGQSKGSVSYEVISGNEYVTVDARGVVKAIKADGIATIKATKAGDNNYKEISATYTINTVKANQTGFAFEKTSYSVQYGVDKLTVIARGGQTNGTVTYKVLSGDVGTVTSKDNKGTIAFNSGKKGEITIVATLEGNSNYNEASATADVYVNTNDFSNKYAVDPSLPDSGWYTTNVVVNAVSGYKISTSGQFNAEWKDSILITNEGKNAIGSVYLKEVATGYISEPVSVDDIYIDKTIPTGLEISYSRSIIDTVLEKISFGFYDSEMTVTLKATDNISKIDHFVYSIGDGKDVVVDKKDLTFSGNNGETATVSFNIAPNMGRSKVTLTAYDAAGNSATVSGDKTIVADDIAPEISVSFDNNDVKHASYFNGKRTATITIKEENFFKDNLYTEVYKNDENGNRVAQGYDYLTITVGKRLNNETDYTNSVVKPVFTKYGDVYKAEVEFAEEADYTFDVSFYDYSLNKNVSVDYGDSEAPTSFTIDKTVPVLDIVFNDTEATESDANESFYQGKRTVTIKVTEHNFEPSELVFTKFDAKNVENESVNETQVADFIALLHNAQNWSHNGDVHTAVIEITDDADYTIALDYSDLAGNVAEQQKSHFCLDNTKPYVIEGEEISYSTSVFDTVLNAITFGFYNAEVTVDITAYDETAGIDYFTYSYTVDYSNDKVGHEGEEGHSSDSGKQNVVIPKSDITFSNSKDGKKATATFKIPEQFRGYVSFSATDRAGNTSDLFKDDKCIVVDNVAPGVNVTYDNTSAQNSNYYKSDRKATISISADNFFKDYLYCPIDNKEDNENYLVIKVGKRLDNQSEYSYSFEKPEFVKDGNVYKATVEFNENADYTFDIKYTDKSHNVYDSYVTDKFTVDKIEPTVDVEFSEPAHSNGNQYREDRTATITIVEHNFDAKDVVAKVTAVDAQGKVFDYASYLKNNSNWKSNGDVHTAVIKFNTEAHYTFDISYTDLAGNVFDSFEETSFTVDKTAPTDMDIKINNVSVVGTENTIVFDTFYGSTVAVKLSANCDISGLESLKYQKVANAYEYDENGTWIDYNNNTGIVVSPSEKFIIFFRAEDRAGNVNIIRSTGIVVDNQKPIGETKAPEIDILPVASNENGFYNDDVKVDLKVVDPSYLGTQSNSNGHYSGLNKITYRIYTTDTKVLEEGTLLELGKVTKGAVFDSDKLISSWKGNIVINSSKFNSNNVVVEVTAIDNAGNSRTSTTAVGDIKIDITAPTIAVTYNNNDSDSWNYFKSDRTATIVVTERNFVPKDVKITLTNTDGTIPKLSKWTKVAGTGNSDDTTWTTRITYKADGDYTFGIEYTDLAGWTCGKKDVDYGESVAPTKFTIDKTRPTVSVAYDNNDAQNGNYYKANRTATVVVNEHNFNEDRVKITLTATDDGANTTKPTVSAWKTIGDKHTATIRYAKDAKYTFDIEVLDKAGNVSADYKGDTFYVDTTKPTIEIKGVGNNSANNGDVAPIISYNDTNYDADKVTITLSGANRKGIKLDGSYKDIHNGREFTFKNFAKEKSVDDIYTLTATLTDKAGNTATETITFSVNRFGSTYSLSDIAKKINGTYIKEAVDVVFSEINADALSNIKLIIFKDGESYVLKEGSDYAIKLDGGNGQWYRYTYTVFAKNFDADGVYSVIVESDDRAGNEAKNDQDTKNTEMNFGVDSTLPIVNVETLESKTTYALDNLTVKMSIKDNLKLTKVIVELDGKEYKVWSDDELEELVKNGGNFSFDISGNSTDSHNLVVYAIDAAGNGQKIYDTELPANAEKIDDFYVTTNLWVRYYTNKPLFFGSIAGAIVLAGLIVSLIVYKKKKEENRK